MQLSSQVQQALTYIDSIHVTKKKNPWRKRREFDKELILMAGEKEAVFHREDIKIQGEAGQIKLRIYCPCEQNNLPVIICFHEGWFNSGQSSFSGLPPTCSATAEYDPLRDEGIIYCEKLEQNGVIITLLTYGGMMPVFFQMDGVVNQSAALINDMVKFYPKHSA